MASEVKLYPNPVKDYVNISLITEHLNGPLRINIYSASGHLMDSFEHYDVQGELTYDLSEFPAGLYVFSITSGKMVLNKKLIVQ